MQKKFLCVVITLILLPASLGIEFRTERKFYRKKIYVGTSLVILPGAHSSRIS